MSDYTPTTEEVANDYECVDDEETFSIDVYKVRAGRRQRFYAWLASHDAQKRAEWEAEQGEAAKSSRLVDTRDPQCVEAWPGCHSFGYDPACCRFPKSCSAGEIKTLPAPDATKEGESHGA